ncbi:unnamed protein product [Symbiodinium sp. CCMP2592]|nr:unnamed protein product [Symbiodinium sp. CCMP2592]
MSLVMSDELSHVDLQRMLQVTEYENKDEIRVAELRGRAAYCDAEAARERASCKRMLLEAMLKVPTPQQKRACVPRDAQLLTAQRIEAHEGACVPQDAQPPWTELPEPLTMQHIEAHADSFDCRSTVIWPVPMPMRIYKKPRPAATRVPFFYRFFPDAPTTSEEEHVITMLEASGVHNLLREFAEQLLEFAETVVQNELQEIAREQYERQQTK